MLNRSRRLIVLAALVAMAALVAAVPVHHAHMMHLALADGAEPSTTAVHDKADCHHHHHGGSGHDHAGHLEFEMPRCPVCSTVQMAVLQLPPLAPLQLLLPERSPERIETAAAAIPRAGHFRPVQPRAPPIAV